MNLLLPLKTRRDFLRTAGGVAACFTTAGAFAEALTRTPSATEGPYYPNHLPLDTDNDLIVINNALTSAVGEVGYVSGRVLDAGGKPVRNALVEIWQCDAHGVYLHTGDTSNRSRQDNSRGSAGFRLEAPGSTCFGLSSPCRIRPGRRTSISRSVAVARNCSRPSSISKVIPATRRTRSGAI